MNNQILYERLRDLRERNHFTQAFVSSKLNIGRATYSNYFLNSENLDLIAASKEPPVLPLTPPEQQLMDIYRSLSSERREQLVEFALFLQNQP